MLIGVTLDPRRGSQIGNSGPGNSCRALGSFRALEGVQGEGIPEAADLHAGRRGVLGEGVKGRVRALRLGVGGRHLAWMLLVLLRHQLRGPHVTQSSEAARRSRGEDPDWWGPGVTSSSPCGLGMGFPCCCSGKDWVHLLACQGAFGVELSSCLEIAG